MTIGWLLAILVLIITIILMILGMIDIKLGLLLSGLALARLL